MKSGARNVREYLASLPQERRRAISAVRRVVLDNLPAGFAEGMQYGMIGYFVPHAVYPGGYHVNPEEPLPYAHLASQKNYMALYLSCACLNEARRAAFERAWRARGDKPDMGKSCIRFKRLEQMPPALVGGAIAALSCAEFIAQYERRIGARHTARRMRALPHAIAV